MFMSYNLVYGPMGMDILEEEKTWCKGNILGPLLYNLQLAMTNPISRGSNLIGGPIPPSI